MDLNIDIVPNNQSLTAHYSGSPNRAIQGSGIAKGIDTYRKNNQSILVLSFRNKNLDSLSFLLYLMLLSLFMLGSCLLNQVYLF
jgi:hypothetical protein